MDTHYWEMEKITSSTGFKLKQLSVFLRCALTTIHSAACCNIKATVKKKIHILSECIMALFPPSTTDSIIFFCSPTRWVMTSPQVSLSSSWTISPRKMRGHLPARSQMEAAKDRAHWFWLETVREARADFSLPESPLLFLNYVQLTEIVLLKKGNDTFFRSVVLNCNSNWG